MRPAGFAREKHSYRDAYASRQSAYVESSRSISRGGAARGPPVLYDDDYSYGRYVERERPSTYRDSHSRDYPSFSGTKRPYSAIVSYLVQVLMFLGTVLLPFLRLILDYISLLGGISSPLC